MWCRPIFHRKAESVLDTFAPNFASILPPTKYINPFKFSFPFSCLAIPFHQKNFFQPNQTKGALKDDVIYSMIFMH